MKNKTKFLLAAGAGLLSALLIILLRFVDVEAIGPQGTSIGLAQINQFFFKLFGVHLLWYTITDWLGVAALLTAAVFALAGLVQLIKRRSLLKVDKEIFALGVLYSAVIGIYVLFERVVMNYRPIILPGCTKPEASFPSSHTMLVCVMMGSAFLIMHRYIKNKNLCRILQGICAVTIAVTVAGRLISGVHWFTDICGGILISTALLALFSGVVSVMKQDYSFRLEEKQDYRAVESLIRESFWNVYKPGCSEHFVMHTLRDDPAFVKELDFVMELNGDIIGQNMFMKTVIEADDGSTVPVLTMGPICITPALKRKGYGKALLDYSLEKA